MQMYRICYDADSETVASAGAFRCDGHWFTSTLAEHLDKSSVLWRGFSYANVNGSVYR